MAIWDKIFGKTGDGIVKSTSELIDTISVDDEEKSKLKQAISQIVLSNLNTLHQTQADILKTEMKGNWLQRNWRPMMMLTFGVIIICKWFGWTDEKISDDLEMKLLEIIELGLVGYVGGRTLEKISESVTKNVDLTFLKKKDRKDKFIK